MAIAPRLDLRQTQTLVMTPQLRQAIKLLQYSNLEAASFVEEELERNPLLERDESAEGGVGERPAPDQMVVETISPTDSVSAATADTLPSEAAAPLDADQTNDYDPGSGAESMAAVATKASQTTSAASRTWRTPGARCANTSASNSA
jgi:RNA polymerase sigma-54 factor